MWHVLGFDIDDIVGAGQHWRLAQRCARALLAGVLDEAGVPSCRSNPSERAQRRHDACFPGGEARRPS
jgi:hypothetical protein